MQRRPGMVENCLNAGSEGSSDDHKNEGKMPDDGIAHIQPPSTGYRWSDSVALLIAP